MIRLAAAISLLLLAPAASRAAAGPPAIVAAEAVYADVARQVAGPDVPVAAILSNPDTDPHLFEAAPSTARALAVATIVIGNGAGYDPWLTHLLTTRQHAPVTIMIDLLVAVPPDGNPHLWFDPDAAPRLAQVLAERLAAQDPAHAGGYRQRAAAFATSFKPLAVRIAAFRTRWSGTAVTATEPVFGLMAQALGLVMQDAAFQRAVMNDTEPAARDVAAMEAELRDRRVRVLIYNSQASDAAAQHMVALARRYRVPVLGVGETLPAGTHVQDWIGGTLDRLAAALAQDGPVAR